MCIIDVPVPKVEKYVEYVPGTIKIIYIIYITKNPLILVERHETYYEYVP
jgi:hypothetical protein